MSTRSWAIIVLVSAVLLGLLGVGVTALRAVAPHQSAHTGTAPSRAAFTVPPAGSPESSLSARQVAIGFAASYGEYLDGAPVKALRFIGITAAAQAHGGGRVPADFRDGQIHLIDLSLRAGGYSAEATLVLGDRQESYPFGVELLREQHGWMIASLTPPDLTMDRTITPVSAPDLPQAARATTQRLVMAYARYRAGAGGVPHGLSSAAAAAIRSDSDSLAGIALGSSPPRLMRLVYGPLNASGEFAATATVGYGARAEQFSVLMKQQRGTGQWLCAAFL